MINDFNFNKVIVIIVLCLWGVSCQKEPHITDNYFYGVVFENIEIISDLDQGLENSPFMARVELTAPQNGAAIDRIEVYVAFQDRVFDVDNSTSSTLSSTIPNSEFVDNLNERGRPVFQYNATKQEFMNTLGLSEEIVNGDDRFEVTFKAILENNIDFQHVIIATVICTENTPPTPGNWKITLKDDFSDSWDGALLKISVDNEITEFTMDDGESEQTFDLIVPNDATTLSAEYIPGFCCSDEHSIIIVSARDLEVLDIDEPKEGIIGDFEYCGF